jgi:hypothetical protein
VWVCLTRSPHLCLLYVNRPSVHANGYAFQPAFGLQTIRLIPAVPSRPISLLSYQPLSCWQNSLASDWAPRHDQHSHNVRMTPETGPTKLLLVFLLFRLSLCMQVHIFHALRLNKACTAYANALNASCMTITSLQHIIYDMWVLCTGLWS